MDRFDILSYTTKEMSQSLLDAGLDRRTADMWYSEKDGIQIGACGQRFPAWSLARLMALLPEEIIIDRDTRKRKRYELFTDKYERFAYGVGYDRRLEDGELDILFDANCQDSIIYAVVDTLVFVLKNGYEDRDMMDIIIGYANG